MMMITVVVGEIDCVGSHWRERPVKTSPMKIPSKYPLQDFISQLGQILKVFKDNFFLYKVYFWDKERHGENFRKIGKIIK